MSNGEDYEKPCTNCKQTIIMSGRSGRWLPYEKDNSPHQCIARSTATKVQPKSNEPETTITQPQAAVATTVATNGTHKLPPELRHHVTRYKIFEDSDAQRLSETVNAYVNAYEEYGGRTHGITTFIRGDNIVAVISHNIPKTAVQELENAEKTTG